MASLSRRRLLAALGAGSVGALAGCNAPGGDGGTTTGTAATVDLTDHYLCVVNRDDRSYTVRGSFDPVEAGDGFGLTMDVAANTAKQQTGIVSTPGQHDVTVAVEGTEMSFGWLVEADEITGVYLEIGAGGSVTAYAGGTEPCEL
jgi:hypothetical protein